MAENSFGVRFFDDPRDGDYTFGVGATFAGRPTAPPPGPVRLWTTAPTLDQGDFPHCVAFSWANWLRSDPLRQGVNLDTTWLYTACQRFDEFPGEDYSGTSLRAGVKVLKGAGFVGLYVNTRNEPEVRNWVRERGPVVVASKWLQSMSALDSGLWARPLGAVLGAHAWLIVGHNANLKAYLCQNSWGTRWGRGGFFALTETNLATLMQTWGGHAITAVERRP